MPSNIKPDLNEKILKATHALYPEVFSQSNQQLSQSILKASDRYVFEENSSPWVQEWFKDAYLSYFIHNQASRLLYVLQKSKTLFKQAKSVVDFGCGPATAQIAAAHLWDSLPPWINVDSAPEALKLAQNLCAFFKLQSDFKVASQIPAPPHSNSLLLLSFSLCEGLNLDHLFDYEHIVILEPGQKKFSKNLIQLRKKALLKNYLPLAPCPHVEDCPMEQGDKKWCHDSSLKPPHLNDFKLPFSEKRLNFSYLILSRSLSHFETSPHRARLIGDLQKEKGKTKVAICRNQNTEFLSWLNKFKLQMEISRGDLVELPIEAEKKGQELRIEKKVQIISS